MPISTDDICAHCQNHLSFEEEQSDMIADRWFCPDCAPEMEECECYWCGDYRAVHTDDQDEWAQIGCDFEWYCPDCIAHGIKRHKELNEEN